MLERSRQLHIPGRMLLQCMTELSATIRDLEERYQIPENHEIRDRAQSNAHLQD